MSDRRLRQRAREAALASDPEATARALRERLRAGQGGWVEAAARLGHEPARKALGQFVPVITGEELPVTLAEWGREATRLALLALARGALADWERARPRDRSLRAAVERLGQDPAAAVQATREARRAVEAELSAWEGRGRGASSAAAAEDATPDLDLIDAASRDNARFALLQAEWAAEAVLEAARALAAPEAPRFPALRASLLAGHLPAIRRDLAEWALSAPPGPAPEWPDTAAHREREETRRAAAAAFQVALRDEAVERAATALRRALRQKRLIKARVTAAALLGDPAAWLVTRPELGPELAPPSTAQELARRLEGAIEASQPGTRQRGPLPEPGPATSPAARRRGARAEPRWPEWGQQLALRWAQELTGRAGEAGLLRPMIAAAVEAGEPLPALWERLRRTGIEWLLLREPLLLAGEPRGYAPGERYEAGEALRHPAFGVGRVRTVAQRTVEVEFADGVRQLLHGERPSHAGRGEA